MRINADSPVVSQSKGGGHVLLSYCDIYKSFRVYAATFEATPKDYSKNKSTSSNTVLRVLAFDANDWSHLQRQNRFYAAIATAVKSLEKTRLVMTRPLVAGYTFSLSALAHILLPCTNMNQSGETHRSMYSGSFFGGCWSFLIFSTRYSKDMG